jgi:hypothetical protein
MNCSVLNCTTPIYTKKSGLCQMHYLRLRRHGDVNTVLIANDGEGSVTTLGYREHNTGGVRQLEHILIAERAMGHPMPVGAEVHHFNGDRSDNSRGNLVVCQDHAYHFLLERRGRALRACGNPDWLKCPYCGEYDEPRNITTTVYGGKERHFHEDCRTQYNQNYERN